LGSLISLRGDGPWRGKTTRAVNDRGARSQSRIVNGYVSSDGHEIRARPGWHTICDLTAENTEIDGQPGNGYERRTVDSRLPVMYWTQSNSLYQFPATFSSQTIVTWARPTHLHLYEQVRDRVQIVGESRFRCNPIYNAARSEVTIIGLAITAGQRWQVQTSSTPGVYTTADASGAGGNGLLVGDVVFLEIESTSATISPFMQSEIQELFCIVRSITALAPGVLLELDVLSAHPVTGTPAGPSPHTTTGKIWRTRCNRADVYPVSPLEPDTYRQIDDPDALTLWTVVDPLDLDNPAGLKCQPSHVANRQRDHGDAEIVVAYEGMTAGGAVGGGVTSPEGTRYVSRRRQKPLPMRLNPEVAGNRLVLAAPQYSCLFQCPIIIPTAGENYPSPLDWSPTGGPGVVHWFNDLHDKPRALGLPKALLMESSVSPAPTGSPDTWTQPYNFLTFGSQGTGTGWPAGTYRFRISYFDDFTGEEGLASEEAAITLVTTTPAPGHSYGLQLWYIHPGYWFSETLSMSLNIYLATDAVEPCAFYKRIPLAQTPFSTPNASAKYGTQLAASPSSTSQAYWRVIQLPPPINTTPISGARDEERLAPDNLQMPRGGEVFRYIRGIGFVAGFDGTHGRAGELLATRLSTGFSWASPQNRREEDMLRVRTSATPILDLTTPTTPRDGGFGLATRWFPPAYTGVGIFSNDGLYPAPRQLSLTELMLNPKTFLRGNILNAVQAYEQRLQMDEAIFDQDKGAAGSPFPIDKEGKRSYMVMPKGQIQVSEPGRPEVMLGPAIQIVDPTRDDDVLAIGHFGGGAIICSKKETWSLNWTLHPQGQIPILLSNEHGCIATNSMVEFDGGLAWLGERGPVATTGAGFEWIGADLEKDFHGTTRRYQTDSKGMMRHAWGCHDRQRGLVYWGLITTDAEHQITYGTTTGGFLAHGNAGKSRFPCNEVLVWSYRTGSFSTWEQPSGLEILWMRPLKDKNGETRICFLAADQRIYALDEEWQDTNRTLFSTTATSAGTSSTSLVLNDTFGIDGNGGATARGTGENLLRVGMPVVIFDADDNISVQTTVSALTVATNTVTLAAASTWIKNAVVHIGYRPDLTIETTWVGDASDNLKVDQLKVRYALQGEAAEAFAKVTGKISDLRTSPTEIGYTEEPEWEPLGIGQSELAAGRRAFAQGDVTGPEVNFKVVITGAAHVRVTDIMLEVSSAG
jgi:hypothetical protein